MAEVIDILLINPGDHKRVYQALGDEFAGIEPPVFAGLFATYLQRQGLRVAIYDVPAMRESAEEAVAAMLALYRPALSVLVVYGLQPSASTQNMASASKIAHLLREGSDTRILMTGTHPAALPERTMREEEVDFVCDREGPITIAKTFAAVAAGLDDFSGIPSLWSRRNGAIVPPVSHEALITDLDGQMPGVAWDLLDMSRYRAHNWHCFDDIETRTPYASIHTSLGCPYRCNFCCINAPFGKPSYRMWSPESVVREIDLLVERYGVRNIKFVDEMFVLNRRHVLSICDLLIQRGHNLNIWAYARVDTVKDDMLDQLRAAGFNWLCLGIESSSTDVRDGADKVFNNEDITRVVRKIQGAGIRVLGNYIFGLPDDTPERMRETLDMALDLNCEFANFYSAMAYPGSALYRIAEQSGQPLPSDWSGYSQHAFHSLPIANRHLTSAEILRFRDQAFQTYFTAPSYLHMVQEKFGPAVVDHIARMVAIPLPRQIYTAD